jgi:hypothetical protein
MKLQVTYPFLGIGRTVNESIVEIVTTTFFPEGKAVVQLLWRDEDGAQYIPLRSPNGIQVGVFLAAIEIDLQMDGVTNDLLFQAVADAIMNQVPTAIVNII